MAEREQCVGTMPREGPGPAAIHCAAVRGECGAHTGTGRELLVCRGRCGTSSTGLRGVTAVLTCHAMQCSAAAP
jgi:hypothetical protein